MGSDPTMRCFTEQVAFLLGLYGFISAFAWLPAPAFKTQASARSARSANQSQVR